MNWFYSRISRADEAETKNLQAEAKKREKRIADVMRQIESTGTTKFAGQNFSDFARLQKQLGNKILGLARGFLSAGANSLVLSLWTVNDGAALELMKSFYENL